jgi:hypothetical protein
MREPIAKIGWSMYVYDLHKPKTDATARDGQLTSP